MTGKYSSYHGHSLELRDDSTFRSEWKFDLVRFWAVGQWSYSNKVVHLKFTDIYDTLKRPDKPDSLVLSSDEKSTQVNYEEFVTAQLASGGQTHRGITNNLVFRLQRLYPADKEGRIIREKTSGVVAKKKKPNWYFRKD